MKPWMRPLMTPQSQKKLSRPLTSALTNLKKPWSGICYLGELTPRSIDYISSYGERLAAPIVSGGYPFPWNPVNWIYRWRSRDYNLIRLRKCQACLKKLTNLWIKAWTQTWVPGYRSHWIHRRKRGWDYYYPWKKWVWFLSFYPGCSLESRRDLALERSKTGLWPLTRE